MTNLDDNLGRTYRRWREAEASGRDDDADAEFRAIFSAAVPTPAVGAAFTSRTMEAVAATATRDARRARRLRKAGMAAGVAGSTAAAYFGAGFVVTFASALVARTFDLLIGLVLRMAGAAQTGADLWSVLTSMGRTAAAVASDPTVTMMLFVLQGIAVAALLALQRLLGSDEESLK
jgi:hypothetical protein